MGKRPPALRGIYRNGKYFWFARMIRGKRNAVSLETDNLAEAISRAAEIREHPDLECGELVAHAVNRYVKCCVKEGSWSLSTERSKGYVLKNWADAMGKKTCAQVKTEHLRAWHGARISAGASATSAFGNLLTIQGFFRWARERERICTGNPVLPLTSKGSAQRIKPPETKARTDFCTPELRDRLVRECPREDLKFALFCGFHAGLRFNEISEAKRFWFDLDAGLLHLRKHEGISFKDRTERTIPLTGAFLSFLEDYPMPPTASDYMLHPEIPARRKNIYRWDFHLPFRSYMASQGCPWVSPHIMRHTFASLLVSAGVSIYKVAQWLGDGVRVVERHYAKLLPNDCEIEAAFQPLPAKNPGPPRKHASKPKGSRRNRRV